MFGAKELSNFVVFKEISIGEIPVARCRCDGVVIVSIPNEDGKGWKWSQPLIRKVGDKVYPYLTLFPSLDRKEISEMTLVAMQSAHPSFFISSVQLFMREGGDVVWLAAVGSGISKCKKGMVKER